jgi:hypothetical protein
MKKDKNMRFKMILTLGLLLTPLMAQASLGWFLLGTVVGSSTSKKTPEIKQDEFSKTVDMIERQIPDRYSDISFRPKDDFEVSEPEKLRKYFANMGYLVSVDENNVVFDFTKEYNKFKLEQNHSREVWNTSKHYCILIFKILLGLALVVSLVRTLMTSTTFTLDILMRLGPKNKWFQLLDHKGRLTQLYKEKQDNKPQWHIIPSPKEKKL